MATTTKHAIETWDTFHNNGPFPTKNLYKTSLAGKGNMPSLIDRYNDAAKEIQRLLKDALDNNQGFRAYGSAWSMNHIAHQQDNMHYNAEMNLKKAILPDEMHPASTFQQADLFFVETGNVIKELHKFVFDHGKALMATGASNGQTIGGCISTGVHGSALNFGAVQDCVVGLNLIIGPNPEDIVYIERHTEPALNDTFAGRIHARIIRNDGLFNAALVGLGAFGFIHGVVIRTEDRYLLKRYVKRLNKDVAMQLSDTLDFAGSAFTVPGEVDDQGKGLRPFHYKVFINPYVDDPEYVIETIYKKPYTDTYPDPLPRIKTAIYRDLIILMMFFAEKVSKSIPKLIKLLQKSVLPPVDFEATGTLGELFWDAPYQGPAYAIAVGVDSSNASKTLALLTKLAREEGPIPGIYAMRFVKQSRATLAFTKFPVTCMIEIDGLIWKGKKGKLIGMDEFCTRTIEVLQENNIPFTIHWGKNADWSFPGLVHHMYGNKAINWMEHRSALLTEDTARLFSNKFLEDTGLSTYIKNVSAKLAETVE